MRAFVIASVGILSACGALAADLPPPVTPIVIEALSDTDSGSVVVINGRRYDLDGVRKWLSDTSDRFGRKDPVIFQVMHMKQFMNVSKVASIAVEFYDDVFLTIPTYERDDPWIYLRYTSSERPFPHIPWGFERKE